MIYNFIYKYGGIMNKLITIVLATFSTFFISLSAIAGGHYTGPDLTGQKVVMFGPWLAPEDDLSLIHI